MEAPAELLKQRREAFCADIQEAAQWSGLSAERMAAIEAGESFSATEFEQICNGLAISPAELLTATSASPHRSVARFRSSLQNSGMFVARDFRLTAVAAEIGRMLGHLLNLMDKSPSFHQFRKAHGPARDLRPWEDGYTRGEEARKMIEPPTGPIRHLERSMNRFGVHVAEAHFETPGIEAASVWEHGAVPVILLNESARRVSYAPARRAIITHELCHLLHDGGEDEIAIRATSGEGTGNYNEAVEQRARAFAPAFLAPRDQVREWAAARGSRDDPESLVHSLAAYWGMSFEGAIWHAKNCGLIAPESAENLHKQNAQPHLPVEDFEAEDMSPSGLQDYPELQEIVTSLMKGLASAIVTEALKESVISFGRAKELLAQR